MHLKLNWLRIFPFFFFCFPATDWIFEFVFLLAKYRAWLNESVLLTCCMTCLIMLCIPFSLLACATKKKQKKKNIVLIHWDMHITLLHLTSVCLTSAWKHYFIRFFLLCDGVKEYTKELVILSYFAYLGFQVGKSYVSSHFVPLVFPSRFSP